MKKFVVVALSRVFHMHRVTVPNPTMDCKPHNFMTGARDFDVARYQKAADQILLGTYNVFDLEEADLGQPMAWNRDPLTGITAPLSSPILLDYRDIRQVGDIKYLWEPNRHLHLVTLAQAYALTQNPAYEIAIKSQLESWIEQCPYPYGPNWTSSLEVGIRLINWSLCWQLLGGVDSPVFDGDEGNAFMRTWLRMVFLHSTHIVHNLSKHSSANNHLIGEAAGVWIASTTWPHWPQLTKWGNHCKNILYDEALRQNAPDGGNREQAVSYQQFVLDFLIISGLAARARGDDFPADYWERIEHMIEFLASIMDVAGHVPMLGDADEGYVVRLATDFDFCPFKSLIATGSMIFDRPDFAVKAGSLDEKSRWLLGSKAGSETFLELQHRATGSYLPRTAFPESGYYILGEKFETGDEVRLLVDAGPLGYLSIAAHGHADSLAITLSVCGEEILVDTGTYRYHTEPHWRRYFRGTSAHNTVQIDGEDQSIQQGNFMWSKHAQAHCVEFSMNSERQRFVGTHDGYRRFKDPVIHQREITYSPNRIEFEITDTILGPGRHTILRHWHLAEDLEPSVTSGACIVKTASAIVTITACEDLDGEELMIGSTDPIGGWVSRRFGKKTASHTIRWQNRIFGDTQLGTRIRISRI